MVCAQLVAFGSVRQAREEGRERNERKREREERRQKPMAPALREVKEANGRPPLENNYTRDVTTDEQPSVKRDDSEGTEDEIIL